SRLRVSSGGCPMLGTLSTVVPFFELPSASPGATTSSESRRTRGSKGSDGRSSGSARRSERKCLGLTCTDPARSVHPGLRLGVPSEEAELVALLPTEFSHGFALRRVCLPLPDLHVA